METRFLLKNINMKDKKSNIHFSNILAGQQKSTDITDLSKDHHINDNREDAKKKGKKKPEKLFTWSFIGLLITQFTVALNDNIFRWLIIPIGKATLGLYFLEQGLPVKEAYEKGGNYALTVGGLVFLLPFVLLSGYGGICADRYSKRRVMIWCKIAEIIIMIFGIFCIYIGNPWLLFIALFMMGSQSAFYSPSKYSSIPEIVSEENVAKANGLIGLTTMFACIFGTVIGAILFNMTTLAENPAQRYLSQAPGQANLWISASVLIGVAVTGLLSSFIIGKLSPKDPEKQFPLNPVRQSFQDISYLWTAGGLFLAAVGSAYYWGLGNLAMTNIDKFAMRDLVNDQTHVSLLLGLLVIGIGVGSFFAGFLTKNGRVNLRYIPGFALGIGIFALALYATPAGVQNPLSFPFYYAACVLMLLGVFSGMFDILLMTYLQQNGLQQHRGQIIAGSNFISFTFMLLASGIFGLLTIYLGFSARGIWLAAGVATLVVAGIALFFVKLKDTSRWVILTFLRMFYRIELRGMENLPKDTGAAVLVGNHQSFLDGLLLLLLPDLGNYPLTEKNQDPDPEPDENGMIPLEKLRGKRYPRVLYWDAYVQSALMKKLSKLYRGLPVRPGRTALKSIREANKSLKEGEVICIFPEGGITRNGCIYPFQGGVLHMLKDLPQVPIIPFHIGGLWGSIFSFKYDKFFWKIPERFSWRSLFNLQFRRHVIITFGKPFYAPKDRYELRHPVMKLQCEFVEKSMMVTGTASDNFNPDQIPIRGFVKNSRKRGKKLHLADSTGAELSGYKSLISAIVLKRVFRREIYGKNKNEQNIGLLVPPSVPGVLANIAITMDRKTVVNLNYTVSSEVMNICIHKADIQHVITSKKVMEKMNFNLECDVIYLEDLRAKITVWDKIVAAFMTFCLPLWLLYRMLNLHNMDPDENMTIIFTSGSTGIPKGVMLSHKNIGGNIISFSEFFHIGLQDSVVGILPFFHSFGYTTTLWTVLTRGLAGYYHYSPLDVRVISKLFKKYQPTIGAGTPTFLRMYARAMSPEEFKSINLIAVGGERCPVSLIDEYRERFKIRPVQGYGITECSPVIAANIPKSRQRNELELGQKDASVGFPLPGVSIKVLDLNTGEECAVGQTGMLWVKGILIMKGYYNDPEKTAEVIKDGWYCTGDLVYLDEDSYIYIAGRLSRFSKLGGEMVPHEGLEERLNKILGNSEEDEPKICVTSVSDKKKGEKLVVLYTSLNGKTPEDLTRGLLEMDYPPLWIPASDAYVQVDHIPLLGSGKLDLYAMKKRAEEIFKKQLWH
ncbi:MAG: MFS transporter [Planctomycetia bacterium]|nr:MFS transporter [Planctomycetia bacterium]